MNENVFIIFSLSQTEKVEPEASQLGVRGSSLSRVTESAPALGKISTGLYWGGLNNKNPLPKGSTFDWTNTLIPAAFPHAGLPGVTPSR